MKKVLYWCFVKFDAADEVHKGLYAFASVLTHLILILSGVILNNLLILLALWAVLCWGWHLRWEYNHNRSTITMGHMSLNVGDKVTVTGESTTQQYMIISVNSDTTITITPI